MALNLQVNFAQSALTNQLLLFKLIRQDGFKRQRHFQLYKSYMIQYITKLKQGDNTKCNTKLKRRIETCSSKSTYKTLTKERFYK